MSQRDKPADPKPYYEAHVSSAAPTGDRLGHPTAAAVKLSAAVRRCGSHERAAPGGPRSQECVRINNAGCPRPLRARAGSIVIYPEGISGAAAPTKDRR